MGEQPKTRGLSLTFFNHDFDDDYDATDHDRLHGPVTALKVDVLTLNDVFRPIYLNRHIRAPKSSTTSVLPQSMALLHKPTTRTHFANRAFRCTGPSAWNSHIV